MKAVLCTQSYRDDLSAIEERLALDSPGSALDMWLLIDEQVDQLADELFRAGQVERRTISS